MTQLNTHLGTGNATEVAFRTRGTCVHMHSEVESELQMTSKDIKGRTNAPNVGLLSASQNMLGKVVQSVGLMSS